MVYKNFKTIKIKGGLGNQLFQYAFALFLKDKFNTEINLEISWYKEQSFRRFELSKFLAKNEFPLINSAPSFLNKRINYSYLSENLITFLIKKNYFLPINFYDGYWQDIFFANFLRDKTFFKSDILKRKIKEDYYVIHLRRGDFKNSKAHIALSDDYYLKFIQVFKDKKIYIISEEEEDAINLKKKIKLDIEYYKCSDLEAFSIIHNAFGGIASNSTFCWWAIFLSESRNWLMPYQWLKKMNIIDSKLAIPKTILI
jgi:hypothetical protein